MSRAWGWISVLWLVRISKAVPSFVVTAYRRQRGAEERQRFEHVVAAGHVRLDLKAFLRIEVGRLPQHGVRHTHFADVVKHAAAADRLELVGVLAALARRTRVYAVTRSEWPAVYGSRASMARANASSVARHWRSRSS